MKKLSGLFVLVCLIVVLGACGKKEVQPAEIDEATAKCEICNMAVADNQFATQIVLKGGKSLMFDDIGCMHKWLDENKDKEIDGEFVRDYDDKEWIPVDKASYVYDKSVKTPMAYNVVSFKDKSKAENFASKHEGSKFMSGDELKDFKWEMNKDMMEGDHGDHAHDEENAHDNGHKEDPK